MKILIVDDDDLMQLTLKNIFKDEQLTFASSFDEAQQFLHSHSFQVAFLDIQLKKGTQKDGVDLLRKIREFDSYLPCVMISGLDDHGTVSKCLELGAVDYVAKGTVSPEAYKIALFKAVAWRKLLSESEGARNQSAVKGDYRQIRGESPAIANLKSLISKIGILPGPFLIVGETGTGKELIARALWASLNKVHRPFIPVNCASLPENLIESELFGYERGAFTGALVSKAGLFEAANGGDIFLDEIGELSTQLQAKLLRVLQEKKIRRLGAERERPVEVRIIAATNVNLPEAIKNRDFREDLFYRLNVHQIVAPPLRERKDDIVALLRGFMADRGVTQVAVDKEAERLLLEFEWPGNVRQLESLAQFLLAHLSGKRSIVSAETVHDWLKFNRLPGQSVGPKVSQLDPIFEVKDAIKNNRTIDVVGIVENLQKTYVETALKETAGNRSHAARILGVSRQRLSNWLSDWGIY